MKPFSRPSFRRAVAPLTAALASLVATAAIFHPHLTVAQDVARYVNPVIDANFPDPSILLDQGVYYAYATNAGPNMLAARSTDLIHWTRLPDAMPVLPRWVKPGRTWAPEVRAAPIKGRYVAYFTGWDAEKNTQAIGVATASNPAGPFTSADVRPLVDQADQGGAIDPSCFIDTDGTRYLVWKNDGNSRGQDTWLQIQRLSSDGLHLTGAPRKLLKQDQAWEGSLIEAPTIWKHGDRYYLFYSANAYNTCDYAMGYAVAPAVDGPYVKQRKNAWVGPTPDVCGPGGADIVMAKDGRTWMAYHEWRDATKKDRVMSVDPLVWDGDVPYLLGPSRWEQPAPVPVNR